MPLRCCKKNYYLMITLPIHLQIRYSSKKNDIRFLIKKYQLTAPNLTLGEIIESETKKKPKKRSDKSLFFFTTSYLKKKTKSHIEKITWIC